MGEDKKQIDESGKNGFNNVDKLSVKWTVKDSIFCNLFEDKKYALQLYRTLHPEDTDVILLKFMVNRLGYGEEHARQYWRRYESVGIKIF